jgi:hypothetical protein
MRHRSLGRKDNRADPPRSQMAENYQELISGLQGDADGLNAEVRPSVPARERVRSSLTAVGLRCRSPS